MRRTITRQAEEDYGAMNYRMHFAHRGDMWDDDEQNVIGTWPV
jgi:hypothetical protein